MKIATTIALGLLVASCEPNRNNVQSEPASELADSELLRTNPSAAVLDADLRAAAFVSCAIAQATRDAFRNLDDGDSAALLSDTVDEAQHECAIYTLAVQRTRAAFDNLKSGRTLDKPYLFGLFVSGPNSGNDVGYTEQDVGLFLTELECQEVEEMAHEYGLPTRRCRVWKPLF